MRKIGIIGGGAAGFFSALILKEINPNLEVQIFEKTNKTLTKLRVSGGGRCNVTHFTENLKWLSQQYPRGGKFLYPLFKQFGPFQMIDWLKKHGVITKVEEDNRVFPISDSSETIAGLFEQLADKYLIQIYKKSPIINVRNSHSTVVCEFENKTFLSFDSVIIASGGFNKMDSIGFLDELNLSSISTCPSLFSFNILDKSLHNLKGLSVERGSIKFEGIKELYQGPLLITHWGLSGPAILKASAWQAFELNRLNYKTTLFVNWTTFESEAEYQLEINALIEFNSQKQVGNLKLNQMPQRLWLFILEKSQIESSKKVNELKKVDWNRLMENCIRMPFKVESKTTNKDEFVTAGGISLKDIHQNSCEIKQYPNIYCIGEALDVDGITGGFNFQAAWSTAYAAATKIASLN